jgi:hypothetical protein
MLAKVALVRIHVSLSCLHFIDIEHEEEFSGYKKHINIICMFLKYCSIVLIMFQPFYVHKFQILIYEIWGSVRGKYQYYGLLGCDAV